MKKCLGSCGLLVDDSVEVCKYCDSKSFRHVEDDKLLAGVSGLSVGLVDAPKSRVQAASAPTVEEEPHTGPQRDEKQTKRTSYEDQKSPKDEKPSEAQRPPKVRSVKSIRPMLSQAWLWLKNQLKDPLVMGFVAIVSLLIGVISAPQVLSLVNHATNHAPVIRTVVASPNVIQLGEEVRLTAWADDVEDGTRLNYQWTQTAGTVLGNGTVVTLSTAGIDRGSAPAEISVSLTVVDSERIPSKPYSVAIKISNTKPRLKSIELDKMEVRAGEPVKLVAVAEDPGGERAGELHYKWHCPVGQIDRSDDYRTTLQTAGLNLRSAPIFPKVRVTVTNGRGESTEGEITLSIAPSARKVYKTRKNQATTTTLIIGVKEPLTTDSKTPNSATPQPQTSPGPQSATTPSQALSPADSSKKTTKPPP